MSDTFCAVLVIRLWESQSDNRTNEMNWVRQIDSKKIILKPTLKHLIKLQILEKNNESFYTKNAHLKVANLD